MPRHRKKLIVTVVLWCWFRNLSLKTKRWKIADRRNSPVNFAKSTGSDQLPPLSERQFGQTNLASRLASSNKRFIRFIKDPLQRIGLSVQNGWHGSPNTAKSVLFYNIFNLDWTIVLLNEESSSFPAKSKHLLWTAKSGAFGWWICFLSFNFLGIKHIKPKRALHYWKRPDPARRIRKGSTRIQKVLS